MWGPGKINDLKLISQDARWSPAAPVSAEIFTTRHWVTGLIEWICCRIHLSEPQTLMSIQKKMNVKTPSKLGKGIWGIGKARKEVVEAIS